MTPKIAYLIAAHTLPGQLKRLVRRLEAPWAQFFIHIDAKSPQKRELLEVTSAVSPVQYIPSRTVRWAHVSQVEVTLDLLQCAMQSKEQADRFVLLSGQDYPIKPLTEIQHFFEQHPEDSFIEYFPLPTHKWTGTGGLDRLERFHFYIGNTFFSYPFENKKQWLQRLLNPFARLFLSRKRMLPDGIQFYGGSNWIALTREAVKAVLQFIEDHPYYKSLFKYTRSSDEIFFQTILMNLDKDLPIRNHILHYCDWSLPLGPCPAILTLDYWERIQGSSMLFARKFDETVDGDILDKLDKEVHQV